MRIVSVPDIDLTNALYSLSEYTGVEMFLIIESAITAIVFFCRLFFLFLCADRQIVFMVPLSLLSCFLKVLLLKLLLYLFT